jgi:hypothetical protein
MDIRTTALDFIHNETTATSPCCDCGTILPNVFAILEDVMATEFGGWCFLGQRQAEHLLSIVQAQATGRMRFACAWRAMQQGTLGLAENCADDVPTGSFDRLLAHKLIPL